MSEHHVAHIGVFRFNESGVESTHENHRAKRKLFNTLTPDCLNQKGTKCKL